MSITDTVNFELLRYSITSSRDFCCLRCRHMLDVNRAVMLTVRFTVGQHDFEQPWDLSDKREHSVTVCGDCASTTLEKIYDTFIVSDRHHVRLDELDVIDGRAYTTRGQLRAKVPKAVALLSEEQARYVQGTKV